MKPVAFRIRNFRSIVDSGVCELSGDQITVLAGQNESGKTAVLLALRDFDLDPGESPRTPDYIPEGSEDVKPCVEVKFEVSAASMEQAFMEDKIVSPPGVREFLTSSKHLWIIRDLTSGGLDFAESVRAMWPSDVSGDESAQQPEWSSSAKHVDSLYITWPQFVYFDAFSDTLPREIEVAKLSTSECPQIVSDLLELAGITPSRLVELADSPKQLGNYLDRHSTTVTGDFLNYWKQRTGETAAVALRVRSFRDASGVQKLAFFVRDQVDQYPDQRSRGFVWFLSFYLRLAAAQKKIAARGRVLLIDEPGTYLHARAQRDVLRLFEDRLACSGPVIYTTHSPYLLPPDKLHRVRVVLKDINQGSLVLDRLTHPAIRRGDNTDTLSPVLTSLGMDIRRALAFVRPRNLVVEGITDHIYLTQWMAEFAPDLLESINVFPAFGAGSVPVLASMFVGWGLPFAVLLDRDKAGDTAKFKLERDLLIAGIRIVQPKDAIAIEDMFSAEDFKRLVAALDAELTILPEEKPSKAMDRQNIDKVLLARRYAELRTGGWKMTTRTQTAITRLLNDIANAVPPADAE